MVVVVAVPPMLAVLCAAVLARLPATVAAAVAVDVVATAAAAVAKKTVEQACTQPLALASSSSPANGKHLVLVVVLLLDRVLPHCHRNCHPHLHV